MPVNELCSLTWFIQRTCHTTLAFALSKLVLANKAAWQASKWAIKHQRFLVFNMHRQSHQLWPTDAPSDFWAKLIYMQLPLRALFKYFMSFIRKKIVGQINYILINVCSFIFFFILDLKSFPLTCKDCHLFWCLKKVVIPCNYGICNGTKWLLNSCTMLIMWYCSRIP